MTRRRIIDATPEADDHPALRVLREGADDTWKRWSDDRERREVEARIRAEIERRDLEATPLYPRECAERIAQDTADVAPDWRHFRPTMGKAWGRLLKAQPELAPDLTAQREQVIKAVFASVPRSLRDSVGDLHRLIDLMLTAHESAAYQVGFEAGRIHERQHVSPRGRVHHARRAPRTPTPSDESTLRLHLDHETPTPRKP